MSDEQGDPVCWLGQLCPECGAMPSEESPQRCWRCDTSREPIHNQMVDD